MSAQGAVGTFVVVGTAYLFAEAVATALVVGYIGAAVAYAMFGLLAIVALCTLVFTLSMAISRGDKKWIFDIFAAPLSASLIAFVTYPIDVKILNGFVELMNFLPSYSPNVDDGTTLKGFFIDFTVIIICVSLTIAIGLTAVAVCLSAPFAAIFFMASDERFVRYASYGCYLFTAFYWQTAVLAVHNGEGSW